MKDHHWSDVPSNVSAGCCDACDRNLDDVEESRVVPGMCEGCAEREIELDKAHEAANELKAAVARSMVSVDPSRATFEDVVRFDSLIRQWADALEWLKECKGKMPVRQWPNREEGR